MFPHPKKIKGKMLLHITKNLSKNFPPVCLGATTEEVETLVSLSSDIKVCMDTNHFLLGDTPIDYINHFKDRIASIHISDYDFINERHWLPGEGINEYMMP